MRRNKIQEVLIGLLLYSLAGCSGDSLPEQPEAGGLTLQLGLPPELVVQTKASLTGEIQINDVWVFQYAGENPAKPVHVQHITDARKIVDMGTDGSGIKPNYMIQVATEGFSDVDSRFYVIVNAASDLDTKLEKYTTEGNNQSEANLKAETMALSSVPSSELGLLTSAPIGYTQKGTDTGGDTKIKAVIEVPLRRAYAKVILKMKANSNFAPGAVTVTNFPGVMAIATAGGNEAADAVYPATGDVKTETATVTANWNGQSISFFLGENLRGTGTGSNMSEKGMPAFGPGKDNTGDKLAGCTYLDINGTYTYTGGGAYGVSYRIYLGGNLLNDYNIQRGYAYTLTVDVGGANSADVRVTITDGNLVVFDKVETIEKEINFN